MRVLTPKITSLGFIIIIIIIYSRDQYMLTLNQQTL
jgi:hypothetical protein